MWLFIAVVGGRETSLSRDSDGRDCVQRVLRVDTCDDPVEDSNVRDLLVEAVGAAYQGFYAEGAAVQEQTATSGTCWSKL